jgi:hypothetical protein
MKIIYLLFIIFIFNSFHAAGDELFFRSNELGMPLEKIMEFQRNDFPHILEIRESDNGLIKILYEEEEEIKRWKIVERESGKRVYEYVQGEIETIVDYYPAGKIDVIEYYEEDAVTERHEYRYENEDLRYIRVVNADGEELYRNLYKRDDSGRLIKVVREYPDKNSFLSVYTFGSNGVAREWHGTAEAGVMVRFRDAIRTLSKEEWKGLQLTEAEEFAYEEESLKMSVYKNYDTGVIESSWYNEEGNKIRALKKKDSIFLEENLFEYNEKEELILQYKRTPDKKEKWEFFYDERGERSVELYYKKDRLVSKKEYISEDETYEYLYREGNPFIKIHYKNERKVGEELLIDAPLDAHY